VFDESEWNWVELVHRHSLGWVVARDGSELAGFVNVLWDGLVHAWLQDTMVAVKAQAGALEVSLSLVLAMERRQQVVSICMLTSRTTYARFISALAVSCLRTPVCFH
jgi:hypothetical protein